MNPPATTTSNGSRRGVLWELPPRMGGWIVPHQMTFAGISGSLARTYYPSDEALRHSWENARYMRNDLVVMEPLEHRQRTCALLDWYIEPEDPEDRQAQQLATEVERLLRRIPRFVELRKNLLEAIWYGRYAVQLRYEWQVLRDQMRLVPVQWRPIHGDKLAFRFDDPLGPPRDGEVGIRVSPSGGYAEGQKVAGRWLVEKVRSHLEPTQWGLAYFVDAETRKLLLVHQHLIEDGEFEDPLSADRVHGVGIRSRIYWTWYQKQEALAFLMEFLERSAFGVEIWYYPWGNEEAREKVKQAAEERLGEGRNIILVPQPVEEIPGYNYQRIEPAMAGAETVKEIIEKYFGHLIKRYILGQTLTTEAANTGLGSNLGEIHLNTFLQIIRYDARNLEETLTRDLVDRLVEFNWPHLALRCPLRFRLRTDEPDVEAKLQVLHRAWEMGLRLKAKEVAQLLGTDLPEEGEEVLQNPAVARQASGAEEAPGDPFSLGMGGLDLNTMLGAPGKGRSRPREDGSTSS